MEYSQSINFLYIATTGLTAGFFGLAAALKVESHHLVSNWVSTNFPKANTHILLFLLVASEMLVSVGIIATSSGRLGAVIGIFAGSVLLAAQNLKVLNFVTSCPCLGTFLLGHQQRYWRLLAILVAANSAAWILFPFGDFQSIRGPQVYPAMSAMICLTLACSFFIAVRGTTKLNIAKREMSSELTASIAAILTDRRDEGLGPERTVIMFSSFTCSGCLSIAKKFVALSEAFPTFGRYYCEVQDVRSNSDIRVGRAMVLTNGSALKAALSILAIPAIVIIERDHYIAHVGLRECLIGLAGLIELQGSN